MGSQRAKGTHTEQISLSLLSQCLEYPLNFISGAKVHLFHFTVALPTSHRLRNPGLNAPSGK